MRCQYNLYNNYQSGYYTCSREAIRTFYYIESSSTIPKEINGAFHLCDLHADRRCSFCYVKDSVMFHFKNIGYKCAECGLWELHQVMPFLKEAMTYAME